MICCARLLLLGVVSLLLFLLDLGFISLPGSAVLWPGQKATAPVKGAPEALAQRLLVAAAAAAATCPELHGHTRTSAYWCWCNCCAAYHSCCCCAGHRLC